ncbi:MAG TPA: TetR/AcrR family transcriptional regulator [Chloroflexia bacterium]|nr:TetR/AcrR family transcriptional regulator [Chloroflexia bacterium]
MGGASVNGRRSAGSDGREGRTGPVVSDARGRILDAAQQLFASRGFAATPTKEIAWEAGVPSGLVFYYFPTKRALLLAIIDERSFLPELRALIQAETASHDDPRAELTAVGLRILEYVASQGAIARILASEVLAHPEVLEHLRDLYDEGIRLVADYLREEIRTGKLRQVDVDVLARLFMGGIVLGALDQPADPQQYVSTTVDTLLRGFVIEA